MIKLNDYRGETFLVDPAHISAVLPVGGSTVACVALMMDDGERYDTYAGYGETVTELCSKIEKAIDEARTKKVENIAMLHYNFEEVAVTAHNMGEQGYRMVAMTSVGDLWFTAFSKG